MGYFCLKCGEIYKSNIDKTKIDMKKDDTNVNYIFCPKLSCIGEVIEVDDIFLPIIKTLNNKGYYTSYCCSGHIGDNHIDSYIAFDKTIQGLLTIPKGYKEEKDDDKYCIRKDYDSNLSESETHRQILENAMETLQWAEGLEDIKSEQLMNLIKH